MPDEGVVLGSLATSLPSPVPFCRLGVHRRGSQRVVLVVTPSIACRLSHLLNYDDVSSCRVADRYGEVVNSKTSCAGQFLVQSDTSSSKLATLPTQSVAEGLATVVEPY